MRLFDTPAALRSSAGIHTPHSKHRLPQRQPAVFLTAGGQIAAVALLGRASF
ncbi:MAG: hypothetical protein KME26_31440 [Oscillatoria princeps RMCB-10]|nr:hypothetical protein [Oscillatoria princeps RMCB-10]